MYRDAIGELADVFHSLPDQVKDANRKSRILPVLSDKVTPWSGVRVGRFKMNLRLATSAINPKASPTISICQVGTSYTSAAIADGRIEFTRILYVDDECGRDTKRYHQPPDWSDIEEEDMVGFRKGREEEEDVEEARLEGVVA